MPQSSPCVEAPVNLFFMLFITHTCKIHFRPNNAFVLLVVVFRQYKKKKVYISVNMNFSLFPNSLLV